MATQTFSTLNEFNESDSSRWAKDLPGYDEFFTKNADKPCTYVLYSDYVGSFEDRVTSKFIWAFAPEEDWLSWNTGFNGILMLYVGELQDLTEPLGDFPDIDESFETFYYEQSNEAERESWESFVLDNYDASELKFNIVELIEAVWEKFSGYWNIESDGSVDYDEDTLKAFADQWIFNRTQPKSEDVVLPNLG